ncbi:MAG TPA: HD domain-containing phosphohydrolase [Blastocatellia bacterium]|jgi:diguanylate cyclase (GGDEF)-like protein/putative nucleotidyltransferase with HDIG domain
MTHSKSKIIGYLFTIVVSVGGLIVFAYSVSRLAVHPISFEWVLLSLVTVLLVTNVDVGISKLTSAVTLSGAFIFISVLLYGAEASAVLAALQAAAYSIAFKDRRRILLFNAATMCLSIFASSAAMTLAIGVPGLASDPGRLAMAAGLAAAIHLFLSSSMINLEASLKNEQSISVTWKDALPAATLSNLAAAVSACLLIKLIAIISYNAFIISVPILAATYFTYKVYLDRVETTNRHAEQMSELHLKTIEALAIAIDAKDEVTADHVHRVQIYATGLARLFGLSEPEIEALKAGALLHDIGKLAVPDYILNKPDRLTPAEFEKMKVHTIVGGEILERVGFPYPVVPVVRHHHERWDGRGYPDGLRGDEIPITARILTLADCFDSVREDRQYRKAMTRDEAIAMLKEGSGSVFDPNVVQTFFDHLDEFEAEIREQRVEPQRIDLLQQQHDVRAVGANIQPMAYERIRSAHREVITLYEIAQVIGTSLDLRDTFAVFSSRLEDIVSYTTCVLYMVRPDSTNVEAAHVAGRNAELFRGKSIPSGAGITGWVVANRQPMHNCDPRLDFDVLKLAPPETYRTAIVFPLIKGEALLGALALYSADLATYTGDHLRLMESVAKLASDAIANATHHEVAQTSALTDLLTGLPNARALRYRFEEEADRARRHSDGFAVMMMDLDGFKAVNDKLGHQAGDRLLRELAVLLLSLVRSSDFVSRYAGDEFVAILPVGSDEIEELSHRMQGMIDCHNFGGAGSNLFVGMSVGWASFGTDGETLDELLLAADRAMYADKKRRKGLYVEPPAAATGDMRQYKIM